MGEESDTTREPQRTRTRTPVNEQKPTTPQGPTTPQEVSAPGGIQATRAATNSSPSSSPSTQPPAKPAPAGTSTDNQFTTLGGETKGGLGAVKPGTFFPTPQDGDTITGEEQERRLQEEQEHLIALRDANQRRLRVLEIQQAKTGNNTPPEIVVEIEDISKIIGKIDYQINAIQSFIQQSIQPKEGEPQEYIKIVLSGEFSTFTSEKQQALIVTFAALTNVAPEQIIILRVTAGSIILELKMPQKAAAQLIALLNVDHPKLRDAAIERIEVIPNEDAVDQQSFQTLVDQEVRELTKAEQPDDERRNLEQELLDTDKPEEEWYILQRLYDLYQQRQSE